MDDDVREGDLLDFVTVEEGGYTLDELAGFDRCKLEVTWRGRVRRCSCLMVITLFGIDIEIIIT